MELSSDNPVSGFHVYGGTAALKIEGEKTTGGIPTIAVEAAHGSPGQPYAWGKKLRFQFAERELPTLLATLLGLQDLAEFRFHGKNRDKAVQVKRTPDGTLIKLIGRPDGNQVARYAVMLPLDGALRFATLALQQLATGYGLSPEVMLALIQATGSRPAASLPS